MRIIPILMMTVSSSVMAAEAGYSLLDQRTHDNIAESTRGVEGRINFGGNSERYSGDRWSLGIGYLKSRETDDGVIPGPDGILLTADRIPAWWYINFSHRWYTKPARFKWAPKLRLFVGTGVAYRDVETCALDAWGSGDEVCWDGTAEVSSPWAFHQTFGLKWRERVELAWEHDSTGRFSEVNLGDDVIRFTIYVFK